MGGSRPSAPVTVLPAPTPPTTVYRSIVPEEDYQLVAERMKRIDADTERAIEDRNRMVGSTADIGKRMAERDVTTAAAYQASLPTGEGSDKYDPVKAAAAQALNLAKQRAQLS